MLFTRMEVAWSSDCDVVLPACRLPSVGKRYIRSTPRRTRRRAWRRARRCPPWQTWRRQSRSRSRGREIGHAETRLHLGPPRGRRRPPPAPAKEEGGIEGDRRATRNSGRRRRVAVFRATRRASSARQRLQPVREARAVVLADAAGCSAKLHMHESTHCSAAIAAVDAEQTSIHIRDLATRNGCTLRAIQPGFATLLWLERRRVARVGAAAAAAAAR